LAQTTGRWRRHTVNGLRERYQQRIAAYHLNQALKSGREVEFIYKSHDIPPGIGMRDIEDGNLTGMQYDPWMTDINMAMHHHWPSTWFYAHYTAEDIRFTQKGKTLYAICLDWPDEELVVRMLGSRGKLYPGDIKSTSLLGCNEAVAWKVTPEALVVRMPRTKPCVQRHAIVASLFHRLTSTPCRVAMGTCPASKPGGGVTIKAGSISASSPIVRGGR
jgi:hypothetical protein